MEETNYHPIAVLGIPKDPVHVPDVIIILKDGIIKLGDSGDNIIDASELTAQTTHVTTLEEKQAGMSGGAPDKTQQRNIAYSVCFGDRSANMMKVQIKSNSLPDPEASAALIKRNGFEIAKSNAPQASPLIQIKNKPGNAGTILATVKAPDTTQNFSIDWEYSYDNGTTWIPTNSTGVCDREIKNLTQLKAVVVRARFNIGYDDPKDWMVSNSINV